MRNNGNDDIPVRWFLSQWKRDDLIGNRPSFLQNSDILLAFSVKLLKNKADWGRNRLLLSCGKLTLWLGKLTLRLGGHTLKRGKPNPPINFSVKPQHEEALFKAVYRFTVENLKARADGVIEIGLIQQNQQKSNSLSDWDGQSRPYRLGGPRLETEKLGKKKER